MSRFVLPTVCCFLLILPLVQAQVTDAVSACEELAGKDLAAAERCQGIDNSFAFSCLVQVRDDFTTAGLTLSETIEACAPVRNLEAAACLDLAKNQKFVLTPDILETCASQQPYLATFSMVDMEREMAERGILYSRHELRTYFAKYLDYLDRISDQNKKAGLSRLLNKMSINLFLVPFVWLPAAYYAYDFLYLLFPLHVRQAMSSMDQAGPLVLMGAVMVSLLGPPLAVKARDAYYSAMARKNDLKQDAGAIEGIFEAYKTGVRQTFEEVFTGDELFQEQCGGLTSIELKAMKRGSLLLFIERMACKQPKRYLKPIYEPGQGLVFKLFEQRPLATDTDLGFLGRAE